VCYCTDEANAKGLDLGFSDREIQYEKINFHDVYQKDTREETESFIKELLTNHQVPGLPV
jgi:hypothetical protein